MPNEFKEVVAMKSAANVQPENQWLLNETRLVLSRLNLWEDKIQLQTLLPAQFLCQQKTRKLFRQKRTPKLGLNPLITLR
jgi:hypothetical protein